MLVWQQQVVLHAWTGIEKRQGEFRAGISGRNLSPATQSNVFRVLCTAHRAQKLCAPYNCLSKVYFELFCTDLTAQSTLSMPAKGFAVCSLALGRAGRGGFLSLGSGTAVLGAWGSCSSRGSRPWLSPGSYSRDHSTAPSSGKLSIQTLGWAQRQLCQSVRCRNYPANCFQADEIRAAAAASLAHQCSWWGWNSHSFSWDFMNVPPQGKVLQDSHWIPWGLSYSK